MNISRVPRRVLVPTLFMGLAPYLLAGCASARKPFSPSECNEQSGFERGFVEGKDGRDPDSDYVDFCRDDLRDNVRKGYRGGFEKGHAEYLAWMEKIQEQNNPKPSSPPPAPAPVHNGPTIIIGPGGSRHIGLPNNKAYYCSMQVFMDKYESFGTTELEAKLATLKICEAKRGAGSIFCKEQEVHCQKNQ